MVFSRWAVAIGLGTAVASKLLLPTAVGGTMSRPTPAYLIVNLGLSGLAALLGGATAARLAASSPFGHAVALALLVLLLALVTAFTSGGRPDASPQPSWYPLVLALLGPLGVIGGGWLSRTH